jgi:hypothetical protein
MRDKLSATVHCSTIFPFSIRWILGLLRLLSRDAVCLQLFRKSLRIRGCDGLSMTDLSKDGKGINATYLLERMIRKRFFITGEGACFFEIYGKAMNVIHGKRNEIEKIIFSLGITN